MCKHRYVCTQVNAGVSVLVNSQTHVHTHTDNLAMVINAMVETEAGFWGVGVGTT